MIAARQERRVAVLMTCHDRRDTTLACLARLAACERPPDVTVDVILVDDGCTDGTAAAVAAAHPEVTILPGDGTLFWGRGMHRAFAHATAIGYDDYLWLNDDTMLAPEAFTLMLEAEHAVRTRTGQAGIIVGSTRDPDSGRLNFGGGIIRAPRKWLDVALIEPTDVPQPCESMMGNCTMIPAEVAQRIGNIDTGYEHGLGDFDYGCRARQAGIGLWVAPGFVGTSKSHPKVDVATMAFTARLRWFGRRQMLPPRSWARFCRRWTGPLWPVHWAWPYLKVAVGPWVRRVVPKG
jgi:GT2 family glycosyltransferase